MKRKFLLRTMLCGITSSFLLSPAFAQDETLRTGREHGYSEKGLTQQPIGQSQKHLRLSQVMGTTVKNQQGETLGQINDIVADPITGQIEFAVIAPSFEAQRDQLTAVPWALVQPGSDPQQLVFNVEQATLRNAPSFASDNWPDLAQPDWSQKLYSHYNIQPAEMEGLGGRVETGQTEIGGGTRRIEPPQPEVRISPPDRTYEPRQDRVVTQAVSPKTLRVGQLIGSTVQNPQGQTLGQVHDVLASPQTGQLEFVILSVAGGEQRGQLTAVPWELVQPGRQPGKYLLNADLQTLQSAPTFDRNRWPDLTQPTWSQRIYSHYNLPQGERPGTGGRVYLDGTETGTGTIRQEAMPPRIGREPDSGTAFPRPQPDGKNTFPQMNQPGKRGSELD